MTNKTLPSLNDGTARTLASTDLLIARIGTDTQDSKVTFSQIAAAISDAAKSQVFDMSAYIEGPTNKTYPIIYNADFAGTITATKTKCTSGTATVTFKVNTTAVDGSANSCSSSGDSVTHSTSNTFAIGDTINAVVSSNSSCIDMQLTVKVTRTLA